jgi:hypothetical protein
VGAADDVGKRVEGRAAGRAKSVPVRLQGR